MMFWREESCEIDSWQVLYKELNSGGFEFCDRSRINFPRSCMPFKSTQVRHTQDSAIVDPEFSAYGFESEVKFFHIRMPEMKTGAIHDSGFFTSVNLESLNFVNVVVQVVFDEAITLIELFVEFFNKAWEKGGRDFDAVFQSEKQMTVDFDTV